MRYLLASEFPLDGVFTMQDGSMAKPETRVDDKQYIYIVWANGKLQVITARGPMTGEIVTEYIDLDENPDVDLRSKLENTERLFPY